LTKQSDALKAQIKALEAKKKIIDKELKTQQDITSEMQRQHDYQNAQTDLATQQKNALEHGDYLQAAQLGQDKRFGTMQFAQQGKVSALQAKSDNLGEQIAALQEKQTALTDAISKNTDAVNKATDAYNAKPTEGVTNGDLKLPMTGKTGTNTTPSLYGAGGAYAQAKEKKVSIPWSGGGLDPSQWNNPLTAGFGDSARQNIKKYASAMGYGFSKDASGKKTYDPKNSFEIDHNNIAYIFKVLKDGNIQMQSHKSIPSALTKPSSTIAAAVAATSPTTTAMSGSHVTNININGVGASIDELLHKLVPAVQKAQGVSSSKANITNKVVHKP
jgi:hypothetical protein